MIWRILSPAERELAEATAFYETEQPGLGLRFLGEFEQTVGRILKHPEAWSPLTPHHRRCRLRHFPYGVIYSIQGDEITIAAIMHLKRDPDSWLR